jgi:hypothetical protein
MDAWDRLPWYEQRLLQEGLHAEQPWIQRAVMLSRADDPLSLGTGLFSEIGGTDEDENDLSELGINIRRSSVVTPIHRPAQGG